MRQTNARYAITAGWMYVRNGGVWHPGVVAQNVERGGNELAEFVPEIGKREVRDVQRQ